MPWLIGLTVLGVVGLAVWVDKKFISPPSTTGTVTSGITKDAGGNTVVTVQPGSMGTVPMASALSSMMGGGGLGGGLIVATPTGHLTNITSSNQAVVMGSSGNGQQSFQLGPPASPGTATITVSWVDGSGAAQTTTFVVNAS